MTPDDKKLFIDTNILIYATNELSEWHEKAYDLLLSFKKENHEMYISTQVIREYIAVATKSINENDRFTINEIIGNIDVFQKEFRIIEETSYTVSTLIEIVKEFSVSGKQVHDANIVAAMKTYGLKNLVTHNVSDFIRYKNLLKIIDLN